MIEPMEVFTIITDSRVVTGIAKNVMMTQTPQATMEMTVTFYGEYPRNRVSIARDVLGILYKEAMEDNDEETISALSAALTMMDL